MAIKQVDIFEATPEQRLDYAISFLGLDATESAQMSEQDLFTRISEANGGATNIFYQDNSDVPAALQQQGDAPDPRHEHVPGAAMAGSLGHEDPKVTLIVNVEQRNGETYDKDLPVGVNGRCWLIKRGVRATVPLRVFLAMQDAIQTNYTHVIDGADVREIASDSPRIAYQYISGPSPAEIAEWRERTDALELA
jgi:hypothetical protein